MSRHFGAIRQNGYVVRDIDAAMKHWVDVLGVGPWFYNETIRPREFLYRGQPSEPVISIALANSGELQIELIQQRNDAPSAYKDFIDAGNEGLQHVSSWPDNYDEILENHAKQGGEVYHSGRIGGTRFSYLLTESHTGTIFEVTDFDSRTTEFFAKVRAAAANWDGSDPIRV